MLSEAEKAANQCRHTIEEAQTMLQLNATSEAAAKLKQARESLLSLIAREPKTETLPVVKETQASLEQSERTYAEKTLLVEAQLLLFKCKEDYESLTFYADHGLKKYASDTVQRLVRSKLFADPLFLYIPAVSEFVQHVKQLASRLGCDATRKEEVTEDSATGAPPAPQAPVKKIADLIHNEEFAFQSIPTYSDLNLKLVSYFQATNELARRLTYCFPSTLMVADYNQMSSLQYENSTLLKWTITQTHIIDCQPQINLILQVS